MAAPLPQTRPVPVHRPWLPVAVVGGLLVLLLGAYLYHVTRPQPAAVVKRDIIGFVASTGEVIAPPSAIADARAAYAAPVDKVHTTLGANVKKGDVLVELANASATEDYAQAKATVQAAETAYSNAKKQYDAEVRQAQKQLDAARSGGSSSSVTAPDGTTVTTDSNGDVDAAQQALDQARADRDANLTAYKQQLDAAREAYREARAGRKMASVRAPISGTVVTLNAQPGQTSGENNLPVATIVNLEALQVQTPLTPAQSGYVRAGMPVRLTFSTVSNKQFDGKVLRITTQADPSSGTGVLKGAQYVAIIGFPNGEGLVKPQAGAQVSIQTGEAKQALSVPVEAVSAASGTRTALASSSAWA